jgi:hypothetical protein
MKTVTPLIAGSGPAVLAAVEMAGPPVQRGGDDRIAVMDDRLGEIEHHLKIVSFWMSLSMELEISKRVDAHLTAMPGPRCRPARRTGRPCHLQILPGGRQ